jgi:hypothetical protein
MNEKINFYIFKYLGYVDEAGLHDVQIQML